MNGNRTRVRRLAPCLLAIAAAIAAAGVRAECWVPLVEPGALRFIARQGGEPFAGSFGEYSGELCLEDDASAGGRIELRVRTDSVDTGLPEADSALRSALFLDAGNTPEAIFSGAVVRLPGGNGYAAAGRFALRDGVQELSVPFELQPPAADGTRLLQGATAIRRLDYGVGLGEWLDTQFLDDEVRLEFSVRLRRVR